jgi:sialic acid synthase SpsE
LNSEIKVGDKSIGGDRTFIIAEVGSNHCQDLKIAYESIDAAADAGADAVKFQSINLEKLYFKPSADTINLHKKIDLDESWHKLLKDYCDKKGIIFFSSPTYLDAIDILEEINISLYKLASAQIGTFPQLVKKVALTGKPVVLSTGLVSYGELEKVVRIFKQCGNEKFIILHCNSIYPVPFERVHLPILKTYQAMFNCIVGFSDHTEGIYGSMGAVAFGAKVIEKHFSLSRNLDSPDAPLSVEPKELKRMIQGIRSIEKMLSPGMRIEIQEEESKFKNKIRTRLILNNDKHEGERLTESDFIFLRHSEGVDCRDLDLVLGKQLKTKKSKMSVLEYHDF